jgi:hypothetical protein
MLSERTCFEPVDHHFLGRARAYLVDARSLTFHEAKAWEPPVKKVGSWPILVMKGEEAVRV